MGGAYEMKLHHSPVSCLGLARWTSLVGPYGVFGFWICSSSRTQPELVSPVYYVPVQVVCRYAGAVECDVVVCSMT